MPSEITWSMAARAQLANEFEYIKKDSLQNAWSVYNRIISKLQIVVQNPMMCPIDKYKVNNAGNFRSFVSSSYRISYKITRDGIRILRVRHTKMRVKYY